MKQGSAIVGIAFRNLARHPRRTFLLVSLIAIGMGGLFLTNSVFNSTLAGLEKSFVASLTGDVVIAARSETPFSLFGNEVPIVSEYEGIPPLSSYPYLEAKLDSLERVKSWTPVVSSVAQIRAGGYTGSAVAFGVDPDSYFEVINGLIIEKGDPEDLHEGGVFVNKNMLTAMEGTSKRSLEIGELIILGMQSSGSFHLKKGHYAGVFRYAAPTPAFDKVVLADPTLVRAIAGYTLGFAQAAKQGDSQREGSAFDLDSLFESAADTESDPRDGLTMDEVVASMSSVEDRDALVQTDGGAWSFVLLRTDSADTAASAKSVNAALGEGGSPYQALGWRQAAGMSAQALFALQYAFYAGLGVIAIAVILVIMNSLVVSVMERTSEIGTMRGLGASVGFISRLFIAESLLLTGSSSALGVALGAIIAGLLNKSGLELSNPLLVTLFGGEVIRPTASFLSVLWHLALGTATGGVAWIYPLFLALRIQPAAAMGAS